MSAQSLRLNTTASNIANADSAASSTGEVYRARKPVFSAIQQDVMLGSAQEQMFGKAAGSGVQVDGIVESEAALDMRYQPDHPMADDQGYVMYPNVNIVEEMADMMSASRSFQTNIDVMDAAKTMMQRILTLGQ